MPQYSTKNGNVQEQPDDGVNLLISMLVRYPQIGTISFEPGNNSLKFTFIISRVLIGEDCETVKELITSSIDAYHILLNRNKTIAVVDVYSYEDVSMLTVIRDVPSLSCGEITLIVDILRERFADCLPADMDSDMMANEEFLINDEVIENILKSVRKQNDVNKSLIGIREDGRVFVFNK